MKKILPVLIVLFVLCSASFGEDVQTFDSPVPAEVISERAFVRADHDNAAQRVLTLEEGDLLFLVAEWDGGDAYPWYQAIIRTETGWIYGQNIQRLDGRPAAAQAPAAPAAQEQQTPSLPDAGIISSDGDFVTVIAHGQGTDRQKAMEQAWIESVRLAVGTIISSTSELNNDEFAENTIAHSRGVVDSFDIVGEQTDGGRTTIAIQAKVRKEILVDAARTYSEAQVVQAETAGAIKVQLDIAAGDTTAEDKQKSGIALLKEVLESYSPEMFYSATLNPKIEFDRESRRPYVQITQKFNQELFWDEFVPRLHTALDGVAIRKEKKFYNDAVRQANQRLVREGFAEWLGTYTDEFRFQDGNSITPNPIAPYSWYGDARSESTMDRDLVFLIYYPFSISSFQKVSDERYYAPLAVVVPENVSSYVVYYFPYDIFVDPYGGKYLEAFEVPNSELYSLLVDYRNRMKASVVFSITYLDSGANEIHTQIIRMGERMLTVYRSFFQTLGNFNEYLPINHIFSFSPGYVGGSKTHLFLGSGNFDLTPSGMRYFIELDESDLQKLDSMKFEYIFVNQ